MYHSNFAWVSQGLKEKASAAIIIGLCIIMGFCPQTTEPASKISSGSPGFASSSNNAFLPTPVQIDGELCTLKCNDTVACKRMPAASKETLFLRYRLVSPTSCGNGIYLAYFSGTRGADFKIACQLLNLPPPSTLL
jgi:hypothetical protein